MRWKIEEFHREAKQLTGIESCQCQVGRIHNGSSLLQRAVRAYRQRSESEC